MMVAAEKKYLQLLDLLGTYPKMAVAFSGGVDSTLLLHAALTALGRSEVVAYHLRSALQARRSEGRCQKVRENDFPLDIQFIRLDVDPLDWVDFKANGEHRCYLCKSRMFSAILDAMTGQGCVVLADGTNSDDRLSLRPGLRAIDELSVKSPLAEVNLSKEEIRLLARREGLSNCDQPSNSCLATRLAQSITITSELLELIEKAEDYLEDHGFPGCRVRVHPSCLEISVMEKDMAAMSIPETRRQIQKFLKTIFSLPATFSPVGR